MSDEKLKAFLKKNVNPVPEAPLGESSRIWRHIASEMNVKKKLWWRWAPLLAASLAVVVFFQVQSHLTEVRLEEEYLQREWAAMMSDVNSDFEAELITTFEK